MIAKLKFIGLFFMSLLFSCSILTPVNANYNTVISTAWYGNNSRSLITQNNTTKTNLSTLPFYWDFINVGILVKNNGDMLVTETQKYVFNKEYTNERYRYIPLDRVDEIKDITVTENNEVIPIETGKENNQLWIKWQHKLNAPETHTFKISYRVIGGLHVGDDTTQVYWKAIFKDRKYPILHSTIIVNLPESLAGKITSFTHYPAEIAVSKSQQQSDDTIIKFTARQPITPGKQLEVQVVFPNDILNVQKPQWQQTNWIGIIGTFISILFIWILAFRFGNKNNSGTHHHSSGSGGSGGSGGGGGGGGG